MAYKQFKLEFSGMKMYFGIGGQGYVGEMRGRQGS